jgi:hypothetical protein
MAKLYYTNKLANKLLTCLPTSSCLVHQTRTCWLINSIKPTCWSTCWVLACRNVGLWQDQHPTTCWVLVLPEPNKFVGDVAQHVGQLVKEFYVIIVSKIIDLILLDRLNDYLVTSHLQFGFKRNHSTSMCIFILKETVAYYTSDCTSVYCCFLDATKAFDRVCHAKLLKLLTGRGLPTVVIQFLVHLYNEQLVNVRWSLLTSDFFNVHNGVRQGVSVVKCCSVFTLTVCLRD